MPLSRRQVFDAATTSLNTISLVVVDDSDSFVRTVLCRCNSPFTEASYTKYLTFPRRAIDDEELETPEPTLDEIAEHRAPGLGALTAHALDREQHLLAVGAHAKHHEQRDRGRFAVEPDANDGAVEGSAARSDPQVRSAVVCMLLKNRLKIS